ncbi:hypothetical protein QQF64_034787 [Cirrhinus molitorella]|uniref:Uncharacterized protein n=1 Tax=Cirrhinus molitorella TaxID=172907 RepID=A0ABR3L1N7_9TELE
MTRYFENYRQRPNQRARVRFASLSADDDDEGRVRFQNRLKRSNSAYGERWEDRDREIPYLNEPLRSHMTVNKPRALFRATQKTSWISNEGVDQDGRFYRKSRPIYNRIDFQNTNKRTKPLYRPPSRDEFDDSHEYFQRIPRTKTFRDRFPSRDEFDDSHEYFQQIPKTREFVNRNYIQNSRNRAGFQEGTAPRVPLGDLIDFEDDCQMNPPFKKPTRTQRRNRKRAANRRIAFMDTRGEQMTSEYILQQEEEDFLQRSEQNRPNRTDRRNTNAGSTQAWSNKGSYNRVHANRAGSNVTININRNRGTRPNPQERDRRRVGPQINRETRPQRQRVRNSESNYTPATPRMRKTIKLMYDLVRFVHHLEKVTTKIKDNTPGSFKNLTRLLIDTIKPAMPTREVKDLLMGNAKNWAYSTQLILEEHYEKLIDSTLIDLKEGTDHKDWHNAFQIAQNWARKNFGNRFNSEVLTRVEALFSETLCTEYERRDSSVEPQGATAGVNTGQQTVSEEPARAVTRPEMTVRPKKGAVHVEVQTSPRSWAEVAGGPVTPPNRGDWVFDSEFPPLGTETTVPPTLTDPTPTRPRSPRAPRPRRNLVTTMIELQVATETTREGLQQQSPQKQDTITAAHSSRSQEETGDSEESSEPTEDSEPMEDSEPPESPLAAKRPRITPLQASSTPLLFSDNSEDYPELSVHETIQTENREELKGQKNDPPAEKNADGPTSLLQVNKETSAQTEKVGVIPSTPSTPKVTGRPYRHINTVKKQIDWSLTLKKKHIILGDSNVSRIPGFNVPDLQIDSFPGAKFQHAGNLIERAVVAQEPETIILSFGLNNRSQRCYTTANNEIRRAYRMARERFPRAEVYIPIINYSDHLPLEEQKFLEELNEYIKVNLNFLDALPPTLFKVESDGVHWTASTAKAILEQWTEALNYLNLRTP